MSKSFHLIGKKNGLTISRKFELKSLATAERYRTDWLENGIEVVINETMQKVMPDEVEIQAVEVLWSR